MLLFCYNYNIKILTMKKLLLIILLCGTLFSCSIVNKTNSNVYQKNFSIEDEINNDILECFFKDDSIIDDNIYPLKK